MGVEGCREYTEFLLVQMFGTGIYDLPYSTVSMFLTIIEVKGKHDEKKMPKAGKNKSLKSRGHGRR